MKISKSQYAEMKTMIDSAIDRIGIDRVREHRTTNNGNDKEVRFRWDLFHASNAGVLFRADMGITDQHIDTALKKYVNERGDLWQ